MKKRVRCEGCGDTFTWKQFQDELVHPCARKALHPLWVFAIVGIALVAILFICATRSQ